VIKYLKYFKEVLTMAYIIGDECIKCGACASECPVSCITEADDTYKIDESTCVECGTCASVCPVQAPKQE
jgi:ferredoxin